MDILQVEFEEAKNYLINNEHWDDDCYTCAQNIANKIVKDISDCNETDYYAAKYGRRAIVALCKVFSYMKQNEEVKK